MGLRVVRDDGGPIRFRQALTRTLVGVAAEVPGLLPPLTWFASIGTMTDEPGRASGSATSRPAPS